MSSARGSRASRRNKTDDTTAASAAAKVSQPWADFMSEEGVGKRDRDEPDEATESKATVSRIYNLPIAPDEQLNDKQKGVLVQAGALDVSVINRKSYPNPKLLMTPTRLLPKVNITRVFTSASAAHSVALDVNGKVYGWGRNEMLQLGPDLPKNVVYPTLMTNVAQGKTIRLVAMGKSHTLWLTTDNELWASGANSKGQCSMKKPQDLKVFSKCIIPDDITIAQIACGEEFSVLLDSEGRMYTTGSSEFGQLGNGETGERLIQANKIGFDNCNVFTRRTVFCHAPKERLHTIGEKAKIIEMTGEDIRLQHIACGKNHTLAVEASSKGFVPRIFSWGCGNYGRLGHGIQNDEYFPRLIGSLQGPHMVGSTFKVAAGSGCSLLQTQSGQVYYWGKHRSVGEAQMRPELVDGLSNNGHVVEIIGAGGATVVCSTAAKQTVAWGIGLYGELGLGTAKSSSRPKFCEALDNISVRSMACGLGQTLWVVNVDADTKKYVDALDVVEKDDSE